MSKYEPLAQFLDRREQSEWNAEFSEVEHILGFALPKSAYQYQAWWANQRGKGHSQTAGWQSAGWQTANVDLHQERVTFKRARDALRNQSDSLIEQAQIVSGAENKESLIKKAVEQYAVEEAIAFLIGLGGTMPDFKAAPRHRPGA